MFLDNQNANGLALSCDDLIAAGGSAAVMGSGRNDTFRVVAGTGLPPMWTSSATNRVRTQDSPTTWARSWSTPDAYRALPEQTKPF